METIAEALERPATVRRACDVGGPGPPSLRMMVEECAHALGRRAWPCAVPLRPAHAAVRLAGHAGLRTPARPEQLLRLEESKRVNIGPARADLGFAPRPFSEGIRAEAGILSPQGRTGRGASRA